MTKRLQNNIWIILVIVVNFGLDQVTKIWARAELMGKGIINVVGDIFILVYAENQGAFLSLGTNLPQPWKTLLLILFPLIAIILATLYLIFGKHVSFRQSIAIACIIGGGVGNIYDRIVFNGSVTDFLNFGLGNIRTGVLNVADLSVTFGAIVLFIFQYLEEKKLTSESTD